MYFFTSDQFLQVTYSPRHEHFDDQLVVHYPSAMHEILSEVFRLCDELPVGLSLGGSSDLALLDAHSKSPDQCIFHKDKLKSPAGDNAQLLDAVHPTIVFEVLYSQGLQDVSECAARIIGASLGNVQLVVNIDFPYSKPHDRTPVRNMTASYWEATGLNRLGQVYGGKVDKVFVPDISPNGHTYSYVKKDSKLGFIEIVIERTQHLVVCILS